MKYAVKRSRDSMGQYYATGALTMLETDSLGKAQAEVIARGGAVIDTEAQTVLLPDGSWMDLEEFSDRSGFRF